jgi:hypothetical protein
MLFAAQKGGSDVLPALRFVVLDEGEDRRGALEVTGVGEIVSQRPSPLNADGLVMRTRLRSVPAYSAKLFAKDTAFNYSDAGRQPVGATWTELSYVLREPKYKADSYNFDFVAYFGVIANMGVERWYVDALWVQPFTIGIDSEEELKALRYNADSLAVKWLSEEGATCAGPQSSLGSALVEGSGTLGHGYEQPIGLGKLIIVARLRGRGDRDVAEVYARDAGGHEASSAVTLLEAETWRRLELDLTSPPNADVEFDGSRVAEVGVRVAGRVEVDCLDYDVEVGRAP